MKWWIENNQIVSAAIENMTKPDNWIEVEGVEADDRSQVYFDGETVRLLPPQPSPSHTWSEAENKWLNPPSNESPKLPDWPTFRLSMMSDANYNTLLDRAETKGASRAVTRLETAVNMAEPHHESIVLLWGQVRGALASAELPTVATTKEWEAIALGANMPFEFFGKGEMKLREQQQ